MITILDSLRNADFNLSNPWATLTLARDQLHNAVVLLDKGYSLCDEIEPLLEK